MNTESLFKVVMVAGSFVLIALSLFIAIDEGINQVGLVAIAIWILTLVNVLR